jgi:hypothetical protein
MKKKIHFRTTFRRKKNGKTIVEQFNEWKNGLIIDEDWIGKECRTLPSLDYTFFYANEVFDILSFSESAFI